MREITKTKMFSSTVDKERKEKVKEQKKLDKEEKNTKKKENEDAMKKIAKKTFDAFCKSATSKK